MAPLSRVLLGTIFLWATAIVAAPKDKGREIRVDYAAGQEVPEQRDTLRVERVFKNPAIASGLNSGADTLNRSIDSLMESLFYGLLDNDLVYDLTDAAQFKTRLNRDVYTTAEGSYVVVDRFSIGPSFLSPVSAIQGVPVDLGGEGNVNVMDIYLRTDGMRLVEDREISYWRQMLNNWLGLLPLLTNILPPSFNPNELYDPVRQLETPFQFPSSIDSLKSMPIGSIRSYSFTGGINLSYDLLGKNAESIRDSLALSNDLEVTLPYTIFKTGEHRLNVFKKSEHEVWVGLTDSHRRGHGARVTLGQVAKVFAKVTPFWSGMPALLFPIDVEGSLADVDRFDVLYGFDLRKEDAQLAYLKAVKGDFTLAHKKYLEAMRGGNGVEFFFNRNEDSIETASTNSRNLFVFRETRRQTLNKSEVDTRDKEGRFYILESNLQIEDETWDALVGGEKVNYNDALEIKVERVEKKGEKPTYVFSKDDKDRYDLTLSLTINDRFLDVLEFRDYVQLVRFFTRLPLYDIPYLPLRQEERLVERRKDAALMDPTKDVINIHVTPTYLGSITINAAVYLAAKDIDTILAKSENELWEAFALAYGVPVEDWATARQRASFLNQARWFKTMLAYPLRLFNMRIADADAIYESDRAVKAIMRAREEKTPLGKLDAFEELLDTDHPAHLARALLYLNDNNDIGRSVSFQTKPKGSYKGMTRQLFESLNRKVFRLGGSFPSVQRNRAIREKMNAFEPTALRDERKRPIIESLAMRVQDRPVVEKNATPLIDTSFTVSAMPNIERAKVFVRLEEGGRVNVGRFVIAEKVLLLSGAPDGSRMRYSFPLTGPDSPIAGFLFETDSPSTGTFEFTIAISPDGQVWSEERRLGFHVQDGRIYPADLSKR